MKSSLSHFFIALVTGIAVFVGYGVWYAVISEKSTAVAGLQNQIDTKTETAGRVASARAAISEIAGDEATVQNYFVPKNGVVSFINGLEAQGQANGSAAVSVLSVSTGSKGTHQTLILSLTIKGTFDAVMRTVGAIEYAPYDLSISSFSLVQDTKNSWNANLGLIVGSTNSETATTTP